MKNKTTYNKFADKNETSIPTKNAYNHNIKTESGVIIDILKNGEDPQVLVVLKADSPAYLKNIDLVVNGWTYRVGSDGKVKF